MKRVDPTTKYDDFIAENGCIYVELTKAVYGLIQAARRWYDTFANAIIDLGYEKNPYDECCFNLKNEKGEIINTIYLYVDDGLVFAKSEQILNELEEKLSKKFNGRVEFNRGKVFEFLSMKFDFRDKGDTKCHRGVS